MAIRYHFLPDNGVRPFLIICLPRTGSRLLVQRLDSHPDVLCHGELFNPKSPYLSRKPHLRIGTKEERDADPWSFLQRVFVENDGCSMVGFKIMPNHNNWIMLRLLLSRRVKKIVLTRKNWLQAYVSNQLALQTKQYIAATSGSAAGKAESGQPTVEIDISAFRRYLRKVQLFYSIVALIRLLTWQQFFPIDYSQVKDKPVSERLLDFLGVRSDVELGEQSTKLNVSSLGRKISNYAEVSAALRGTAMEHFLDG